jgi:hypothetical protein
MSHPDSASLTITNQPSHRPDALVARTTPAAQRKAKLAMPAILT